MKELIKRYVAKMRLEIVVLNAKLAELEQSQNAFCCIEDVENELISMMSLTSQFKQALIKHTEE